MFDLVIDALNSFWNRFRWVLFIAGCLLIAYFIYAFTLWILDGWNYITDIERQQQYRDDVIELCMDREIYTLDQCLHMLYGGDGDD